MPWKPRLIFLFLLPPLLILGLGAGRSPAGAVPAEKTPLRPGDLLAAPETYLNRNVEIEIVEALSGPSTDAALKAASYGQVRIMIPDAGPVDLALVPAAFRPEDPKRYRHKFNQVLLSPLRVRGEFLKDEDLSQMSRRPSYVLRVFSLEALPLPAPEVLSSLAALKADPARWNRRRVVYEAVLSQGFEISALDREIWLSFSPKTEILGQRPAGSGKPGEATRARVTGILFSKPGASYGHLGGYGFEILASKVEFLGSR